MSVKRQLEKEMYKSKKEAAGSAIGFQSYTMLPYEYNNQALISLTVNDIRLLNVLLHKLQCKREKGKYITNNGDLSITHKTLKEEYNISISEKTLSDSLKRMIDKGFIIKTRQGGKNMCSLYAVTFMKIGDIKDSSGKRKIDYPPTEHPTNEWRGIAIKEGKQRPASNDDQF